AGRAGSSSRRRSTAVALSALSRRGTPSPLFFAISAAFHAAPLPAPALAGVEVIDVAVRGAAFTNSFAILVHEQTFDSERTGMQGNFSRQRRRPAAIGQSGRGRGDQCLGRMCRLDRSG